MSTKRKILIVDDEPSIRGMVKTVLERAGFEVGTARNGVEAIEMIAASDWDVVLLDVMMPRLDGREVVAALKREDNPVLAHTYLMTAAPSDRLLELPVRGVIVKPFDIHQLVAETKDCIGH